MNVKQTKHDGLVYEMEVTIPANDIDQKVDESLQEIVKTLRQPGFRKGKFPLSMAKKKYGRAVMGEVLEKVVNETSAKALEDKKLRPAIQPKIEVKEFDEGKDLTYSMTVEVLPQIKLADFKKVKLEKLVVEPTGKEVDEALEKLAENRQSTQKVEAKRAAKDGDTVLIDFDGRTADDNVHHQGMKAEGHRLKLGSGQFIPGFEEQLVGKKAGEKVEVKVGFPENYGAKELAGRDAIFDVTIHELHEPSETKIDDEFAKSFGLDDVKALKDAVKEQLQNEFDGQSRMVLKKYLLDQLDDLHEVELPPSMLDLEYKNIMDQIELDRQRNPDQEELSDDEKAEFKDIAARRVRLGLVLAEIGRENDLKIENSELQRAVIAEAQKYPGQEQQVFEYYSKNPQALEAMRAPIFEDKVVDFIVELADVSDKKVSADDLMKALESEEDETPKKKSSAKTSPKKKAPAKKKESSEKPKAKSSTAKSAAKKKAPAKKKADKK